MNKKFKDIFPTFDKFNELVLDPLRELESNPVYYDDLKQIYSFEKIYKYLYDWYDDETHKYDSDKIFITKFKYKFNEIYPSFYFKFNEQNKIAFDSLMDDWFNNISKSNSSSIGSNNSTSESRISETPTSELFKDILETIPITNAQKDDITNAITNNTISESYLINSYQIYLKKKKANFDNLLNNFLDQFYYMFTDYMIPVNSVELSDDLYRFANGYLVNEVDYLGLINSQRIDSLLSKINLNGQNIITINNKKQDKLIAGNNIIIEPNPNGDETYIISSSGGSGSTEYVGVNPIIVNNENDEISLEQSFVNKVNESINETKANELISNAIGDIDLSQVETNKQDIATLRNDLGDLGEISNTNQSEIATIKTQQTQQDRDISDNSQAIETNTRKINDYKTSNDSEISKLKEKDTQLDSEISNIKLKNTTQDIQIQANRELSNQIISGLQTLKPFDYVGEYVSGKTYNKNQMVSVGDNVYLSKEDNNTTTPPSNKWLTTNSVVPAPDLSGYVSKVELQNTLQDYLTIASYNANMQELATRLSAIELKNTQQDSAIETKLDKSVYEEDKQNFALKEQLNEYVLKTTYKPVEELRLEQGLNYRGSGFMDTDFIWKFKRESYYYRTPVEDKEFVNKKYVDDKVSSLPQPDLSNYAKLNETNNGDFFIGDTNGKHIWFAKPFSYGSKEYCSIKFRNRNTNYFTLEYNFNDNTTFLKSDNGGRIVINDLTDPSNSNDAVNKKYVDDKKYSEIVSGTNKLYIDDSNAYKDVGNGKETLASEKWVSNLLSIKNENENVCGKFVKYKGDDEENGVEYEKDIYIKYVSGTSSSTYRDFIRNANLLEYSFFIKDTGVDNSFLNIDFKNFENSKIYNTSSGTIGANFRASGIEYKGWFKYTKI